MAAIPGKQEIHAVHRRDGDVGGIGSRLSGNETGGQKPFAPECRCIPLLLLKARFACVGMHEYAADQPVV